MEGFDHVDEDNDSISLGYRAVVQAYDIVNKKKTDDKKACDVEMPSVMSHTVFDLLEKTASRILREPLSDEDPYGDIVESMKAFGAENAGIFLFPDAHVNDRKSPWVVPDRILSMALMKKGRRLVMNEVKEADTFGAVNLMTDRNEGAFIVNSFFIGYRQIGLFVSDLTDCFLTEGFNDLLIDILTGSIRVLASEKTILTLNRTLLESREALERDGSVLERFSKEDKLTNCLNRRGFFAEAYDVLKKKFKENKYAVVAYIEMDSIRSINEFFGRNEGDIAVKRVARILTDVFSKDCTLGRVRGNEFAVLLVTDEAGRSQELRSEMSLQNMRLMAETDKPYLIHLQFSICEFAYSDGLSLKEMLAETDQNLRRSVPVKE